MAGLSISVKLKNPEAIRAFREAHDLVKELVEDYPWIDDLRQIEDLLQQAGEGLSAEVERDGPEN